MVKKTIYILALVVVTGVAAVAVSIAALALASAGDTGREDNSYADARVTPPARLSPTPTPTATPSPTPSPTPDPYSAALQTLYAAYVLEASKAFTERARSNDTKAQALQYYEPGSVMHTRLKAISTGYLPTYDAYLFEDEIADAFLPLANEAFSCRVRFLYRRTAAEQADLVAQVDYTLFLRPDAEGVYRIYDQYATGAVPEAVASGAAKAAAIAAIVSLSGNPDAKLTDDDRSTMVTIKSGQTVAVQSDLPARYLYLIWHKPPVSPTLTVNSVSQPIGGYGFLHELVTLEQPASEWALSVDGDSILCDVYVFGEGILPDWVQQWQPPLTKADLLVVPTHADDEYVCLGGVLPVYAGEYGMAVQVVYMTNHWWNGVRPHELLDGLWTVGVTAYPIIGPFNDKVDSKPSLKAAQQIYGHENVLAFQVEMLRRFKPSVVVGHDLNGEYGHGAHKLNALTLTEALAISNDPLQYPQSAETYGVWDVPKAYLHLYAEGPIVMDINIPLDRFNGFTAFEMAKEGMAKHVSQGTYFGVNQSGTWQDGRKFGLYRSTVGPDTESGGFFENIVG